MSPRRLPSLPAVPDLGQRLGFDAWRAGAVSALADESRRDRVAASRPLRAARERFVDRDLEEALTTAGRLTRTRRSAALHPLHPLLPPVEEAPGPPRQAVAEAVRRYAEAARALADAGIDGEVYVGPEQLGVGQDPALAAGALAELADVAEQAGVTLTLRTPEVGVTDALLDLAATVREQHPALTVSVVARRHRSEADCARLVQIGARVRLVRGGPREQRSVSWADRHEADLAFVRGLAILLAGDADVVVATHDPTLLDLTDALCEQSGRGPRGVEYQMYLGAQRDLQVRTADAGHRVRVLVPYGEDWFAYLRDLVERPATARRLAEVLLGD